MEKLDRLKYIGYCLSQLPPEEAGSPNLGDFVRYAKFQLCKATHTLMLDPIWDAYTDEEIIVEYYAHVLNSSKESRDALLNKLQGLDETIYDWLDAQIERNQKENKRKAEKMEDSLSFSPGELGE